MISGYLVVSPLYQHFLVPDEGVFLLSEFESIRLPGKINEDIFSAFHASTQPDSILIDVIADDLAGAWGYSEIYYALRQLIDKKYLLNTENPLSKDAYFSFAYSALLQHRMDEIEERVFTVSLCGDEHEVQLLAEKLKQIGILTKEAGLVDLRINIVGDLLNSEIEPFVAESFKLKIPCMLIQPKGLRPLIGPIFDSKTTGCWHCLVHRYSRNREIDTYVSQASPEQVPLKTARAYNPASIDAALSLAAVKINHFLQFSDSSLAGKIFALNLTKLDIEEHPLIKRPQCAFCGQSKAEMPPPLSLKMGDSVVDKRGGFRSVSAEETIAKWQHLISPITGVVTSVYEMPSGDQKAVIHNAVAGHNFAMDTKNLSSLKKGLRSKSGGKGTSIQQAKAGALCEAVERYSGLFTGEEYRISASFKELGNAAIHPNECMLFSEAQYNVRAQNNLRDRGFDIIPDPFDIHAKVEWSPIWSFTKSEFKWLPTGYLYFAYPRKEGQFYFWADSNGSAAGNTIEEAILQGFLEIVERDAAAIWWYNRLSLPEVDLSKLENSYINQVISHYHDIHREIWCLDLTTDIGVPVIAAISRRVDKPVEDIVFAFGCHLDFEIAVLRAVTELNQFLPAVMPIASDGSGEYAYDDPASLDWWKTARISDHAYLKPNAHLEKIFAKTSSIDASGSIGEIVRACQQRMEEKGFEFLVLNQTRPDIGLPVVKVVVPGMRHFWRRCAPGRLYDVPVEMGLLSHAKDESELNPIGIFI